MNLKSRLSSLQNQTGHPGVIKAREQKTSASLQSRLARLRVKQSNHRKPARVHRCSDTELSRLLNAEIHSEGVLIIRERFNLKGALGSIDLGSIDSQPLLPGEENTKTRRNIYIDTETTGLSTGSGTLAFLIGMAAFDNDSLTITLFLLTRFASEATLLSAFTHELKPDDRLVSYNGKTYDIPLLLSRFKMQATPSPLKEMDHLDLLHPVRRLFKTQWDDCRLITLEENLLGFKRTDDLPGSEAPAAWFSYVRHGNPDNLIKVVEHNRQDVISLAIAHAVLPEAIENPLSHQVDLHALARWISHSDNEQAFELLTQHRDKLNPEGKRLLAHFLKKKRNWTTAAELWRELAAERCVESLENLAKYHEHIKKDCERALFFCEKLPHTPAQAHRKTRLIKKLEEKQIRNNIELL